MNKITRDNPAILIMKICATTLGEPGRPFIYDIAYWIRLELYHLNQFFFVTLIAQLAAKKYHPLLYWAVIISTSTAGTTMSDYMDRTFAFWICFGAP